MRTKFDALLAKKEEATFTFYFLLHILLTGWIGHCSVLYYCSIICFLYWRKLRFGPLFCPTTSPRFLSFLRRGAGRGTPPSPQRGTGRGTSPSPRGGASIPGGDERGEEPRGGWWRWKNIDWLRKSKQRDIKGTCSAEQIELSTELLLCQSSWGQNRARAGTVRTVWMDFKTGKVNKVVIHPQCKTLASNREI